ncbi:MAG: hypothetical protein L0Z62_17915 [Gemmataceae bacterium]|nr:hypothetical protein [Gemmataceae bacterium]
MIHPWLRSVVHLALAVLLIANGPVAAALAAMLPAKHTHPEAEPTQSEDECKDDCPCCSHTKPAEAGQRAAPSESEQPCPCCPSCPHDSQGPHCPGCYWCSAAKAPCCLETHLALDADLCPGSPLSERCLLSPRATPNELFHPPRT